MRSEPRALSWSFELRRMPISFGVLLLALGIACLVCLSSSGVLYHHAAVRAEEASRATERRLSHELTQLRAAAETLQSQLDLRAQDIATQAREIERMSAELEGLRVRAGLEARAARLRRLDRR